MIENSPVVRVHVNVDVPAASLKAVVANVFLGLVCWIGYWWIKEQGLIAAVLGWICMIYRAFHRSLKLDVMALGRWIVRRVYGDPESESVWLACLCRWWRLISGCVMCSQIIGLSQQRECGPASHICGGRHCLSGTMCWLPWRRALT